MKDFFTGITKSISCIAAKITRSITEGTLKGIHRAYSANRKGIQNGRSKCQVYFQINGKFYALVLALHFFQFSKKKLFKCCKRSSFFKNSAEMQGPKLCKSVEKRPSILTMPFSIFGRYCSKSVEELWPNVLGVFIWALWQILRKLPHGFLNFTQIYTQYHTRQLVP